MVWRREDDGARRLPDDLSTPARLQLDHSGDNVDRAATINATYTGDSGANAYLDLTKLPSLIPVPTHDQAACSRSRLTDRTQQIYIPQPDLRESLRSEPHAVGHAKRQVESDRGPALHRHSRQEAVERVLSRSINPISCYNGLKEAFDAARAGNDSSPALQVLEDMFKGNQHRGHRIRSGWHALQRRSADRGHALAGERRRQFQMRNLANGNYPALAATLNTLNYTTAVNPTSAGHSGRRQWQRAPAQRISRKTSS